MLLVDDTIALGPSLEGRLAAHGLACTYAPLCASEAPWEEAEGLLLHGYLPDGHLRRLVHCRYIGVRAVRTDYINLSLAATQGIAVQGLTRQYGVNAVAEHTFALIFGLAKHLVAADGNVKGGRWRSGLPANWELKGRTLGIVGYGKIGQRVAEIGRALGMKVLVAGRGRTEGEVALEALLAQADIVSLHLTASEANRDFLHAGRIALIKEGAMVINTTRGLVADYDALFRALQAGQLAGLGLDVFPEEPVARLALGDDPRVLCTPHGAFNTEETLAALNEELVERLLAWQGERASGRGVEGSGPP
jgi:phosphoglycerate dehydrogenase-like enzyme